PFDLNERVAVDTRPQSGVRRIFARCGVVADELHGERVLMGQEGRRNREFFFSFTAIGAAEFSWRGLNGREDRSVEDELEMAQLRKQTGRKRVVDMDLRGADG